jgi:hypothetical protein
MLLSPSLPEVNAWPFLALYNRSTFGMNNVSNNEDENEISQDQLENEQDLKTRLGSHRVKPYRDIPIYTEPGSPLLSRVYLTDGELHSSSTTLQSDEGFETNDYAGIGIRGAFEFVGGSCRTEVNYLGLLRCCLVADFSKGCDERAKDPENTPESARENLNTIKRCSELSFQCFGEPEPLFSDEAAWLRSPLSYGSLNKPFKMPYDPPSLPFERNVESWLSDTSSCGDDNLLVSLCVGPDLNGSLTIRSLVPQSSHLQRRM